jgi:hypothetical protein
VPKWDIEWRASVKRKHAAAEEVERGTASIDSEHRVRDLASLARQVRASHRVPDKAVVTVKWRRTSESTWTDFTA